MTEHKPDNWVILKINNQGETFYKVLAGWSGGYLDGDSWRMNSGIERMEESDTHYKFYGHSGSCYVCHKETYGLRMNNAHVWNQLMTKYPGNVSLMGHDTDWTKIKWRDNDLQAVP